VTADRFLWYLMRIDALVVLCAVPCAILPFGYMETVHRDWLGLGPLPDVPITRYLARSLSLVYALHGAVLFTITARWVQYRSMVAVLAWLHIAFGFGLLGADLDAGVPWWWATAEGPGLVAFGCLKLYLYRRASRDTQSAR
jgi:hypothetical protein